MPRNSGLPTGELSGTEDNHSAVTPGGWGSAFSRCQLCLVPWAGVVPSPHIWIKKEPKGGLVMYSW